MDVVKDYLVMRDEAAVDEATGEIVTVKRPHMKLDIEGKGALKLELKPDGTSYLEEYMDFLENCAVDRGWPGQIAVILSEELASYFSDDRTAEDAVANIQNRVQLYLDEN